MYQVKVTSEILGRGISPEKIPDVHLSLVSEQVSLREIIERSVSEQIQGMTKRAVSDAQITKNLRNQYLDSEDIEQLASDGKVSFSNSTDARHVPNAEREAARAINAFKRKKFKVFIDGEEITGLLDQCALYDGCVINFIRLIPLVGG